LVFAPSTVVDKKKLLFLSFGIMQVIPFSRPQNSIAYNNGICFPDSKKPDQSA